MSLTLKTSSLVDALCESLRERIVEGKVSPADRLTENGVARQYQLSRPTAKAALERLVHQGMLRRGVNKTARVPLLSSDEIRDIYFSRTCLEGQVMAELARTGNVPADAEEALRQFRAAVRSKEPISRLVELDVLFHRRLVAAVGSPRLVRMHEAVIGEAHLCMAQVQIHHLLNPTLIAREHAQILQAIRERDPKRASERLTEHLSNARDPLAHYVEERERGR